LLDENVAAQGPAKKELIDLFRKAAFELDEESLSEAID
jgi:hypothetical protein